jgi:hypothetical protein
MGSNLMKISGHSLQTHPYKLSFGLLFEVILEKM